MPPRVAGVRGRGRGRPRGRRRGRVPAQPEQESRHSAMVETPENASQGEEVQMGAPEVPPPAGVDAGAVLQQLAAAMAGGAQVGAPAQARAGPSALEKFRRLKPPTYDGTADTDVAEQFLEECEKILVAMEIENPATRITLTAFQLIGRASAWWASVKGARGSAGLTWEGFKEKFRDHFFPQSLRDAKREEFAGLIQGAMTVLEYERKFADLSKYAPELISTTHLKCRKFERGLRPALRTKMVMLGLDDYEVLINRAMTVERDLSEIKMIYEGRRGRSAGPQQEGTSKKRAKGNSSAPQPQMSFQGSSAPATTGRTGGNTRRPIVCFNCGQEGHKSTECTKSKKQVEMVGPWGGGQVGENRVCYGCGEVGHIQRFCP